MVRQQDILRATAVRPRKNRSRRGEKLSVPFARRRDQTLDKKIECQTTDNAGSSRTRFSENPSIFLPTRVVRLQSYRQSQADALRKNAEGSDCPARCYIAMAARTLGLRVTCARVPDEFARVGV